MIFKIYRTSDYGDCSEKEPCKNAFKMNMTIVDKRTLSTPEDFDKKFKEKWYDRGTNHRIEDGCIARDIGKKIVWGIELNSLEDLINLQKSVNEEIIIGVSDDDYETPCIEIYDDYRE